MPVEVLDRRKLSELKTFAYWATLFVWLSVGAVVTLALGDRAFWPGVRFFIYRRVVNLSREKLSRPHQTSLVLIHDNAFWGARTRTRRQDQGVIPRDYLAQLIRTIMLSNPSVIALDFVCYPTLTNADETADLIDAIRHVSPTTTVVIPAAINFPDIARRPTALDVLLGQPNVVSGFTRLEADIRRVIVSEKVQEESIDSFAAAAVKSLHQVDPSEMGRGGEAPFAVLLRRDQFDDVTVDAEDLLNGRARLLPHRVVIIGADWHPDLSNTDVLADTHRIGNESLAGAMVHASYIESMLANVVRRPVSTTGELLFDVLFGIFASLALLCGRGIWKLILFVIVGLLLLPAMYFAWENVGVFIDVIPTAMAIGIHSIIERKKERFDILHDGAFVSLLALFLFPIVGFLVYQRHTPRVALSAVTAHVVAVLPMPIEALIRQDSLMSVFEASKAQHSVQPVKPKPEEMDRAATTP